MLAYSRHQVIHAHTGTWWVRIALGFLGLIRNYKTVFTAHSYSFCDDFLKGNFIRRWLQKFILRRASKIIAVNHIIRNELLKIGVPEKTIHIIPAFIPPLPNSGDKIPEEVLEFCKNRSPILTANGAFVLRNGDDIYGLEIMVNMMESLPRVHPNAALVIYIGGTLGSDENLFKKLISRIASGTLKSHILFYRSEEEFYPVLNITDVFLRPTLTDGDAVSLREALYFGVPVVCSDAVSRPEGVAIFSTKDISAFIKTLNNVLANLSDYRDSIRDIKFDDNGQKIYQLITKLFSSK
jgi:glycosyltransferase involved in cell wall biosynthesis